MKKIFANLLTFLFILPAMASEPKLKTILALKPGESLQRIQKANIGFKLENTLKGADYSIQTEGDVIQSIKIDFNIPVVSKPYLKADTKGHCLVQPVPGDLVISRFFFFDLESNRRYELTPKGMIKSILIQNIPAAIENRQCQFSEVLQKENPNKKILKVN